MKGREIFFPKISSMKINDLAKTFVSQSKIKIIGIRSGKKINEIFLTEEKT